MIPSAAEVRSYWSGLSNWGRWGDEDDLGTLNLITPAVRVAAARLVVRGAAISCARTVTFAAAADDVYGTPCRQVLGPGRRLTTHPEEPAAAVVERVELAFHGRSMTHLDALSHISWQGRTYGGRPDDLPSAGDGAHPLAVTAAAGGVVTRGVLLDEAARRNTRWLQPGDGVLPEHLDACEQRQGVQVRPGDAVLLRTGYGRKRAREGPDPGDGGQPGWHAACLPWLRARDVALVGSDTANDVAPSGYPGLRSPVHAVGIVAMGLWLLDNCDLEALAAACARFGHWEFCLVVAPLVLEGASGSPVNPIAMR
jgi:kynurenine formamidase